MIVGITGRAGSGKDYLFAHLARKYPAQRFALADMVRKEIEEALHVPAYEATPLWSKPYPPEIRRLLQWWGTDLRRNEDDQYWIRKARVALAPYIDSPIMVCITDVRFPNEVSLVREMEGKMVRVNAPAHVRADRLGGFLPEEHDSERFIDTLKVDYELPSVSGIEVPNSFDYWVSSWTA